MDASQACKLTRGHAAIALWLVLAACLLCGCRTIQTPDPLVSGGELLDGLHRATLRDPAVTWVDQYALQDERYAMYRWMQQRMEGEFRSLDTSYLLTKPDAITWDTVEANANRYMENTLDTKPIQLASAEGDAYRMLLWKAQHKDYHVALVMTRDPLPGQNGRRLAAYHVLRDASLPLPANVLVDMQRWATSTPPDRLSPFREHVHEKEAMIRWIEQYMDQKYKVIDQRFVLTEPGFTETSIVGKKAHQYVTSSLGGVSRQQSWFHDDFDLLLWNISDNSPQYIAVVIKNEPLPRTRERKMIGYFRLIPSIRN